MQVIDRKVLGGACSSVAVNSLGTTAAVAVANSAVELYDLRKGKLAKVGEIAMSPARYGGPQFPTVSFKETQLAFTGEATIALAREVTRYTQDPSVPLGEQFLVNVILLDLRTREIVGEYSEPHAMLRGTRPLGMGDQQVLVCGDPSILLVDLATGQKVASVRPSDVPGESINEAGEMTDERVSPNGVYYEAKSRVLHVQWRRFNECTLQLYCYDPEHKAFRSVRRFPTISDYEGNGLCVRPSNGSVVQWVTIMDRLLDLRSEKGNMLPKTAEMGALVADSEASEKRIVVRADIARDFIYRPQVVSDASGATITVGYRLSIDYYNALPFFWDNQHVVVNTPAGVSLSVNVDTGSTAELHDFQSPITSSHFCSDKGLLLTACEDHCLTLLRR